ncbi:Uncharacterised protein [Mycobacterium tuberculosis]|uniref:Uncharacterized protein n=1 Tax=Mycobacterium tuberculosis TaxID=1773 RepID=A0A654U6T2_MYCTX|nr:Uncharacterised protein [Mycobacterium tuberculosis]COY06367.1 Uncharacterised protein [Mycobacterium tuberculosis]
MVPSTARHNVFRVWPASQVMSADAVSKFGNIAPAIRSRTAAGRSVI